MIPMHQEEDPWSHFWRVDFPKWPMDGESDDLDEAIDAVLIGEFYTAIRSMG